MNHIRRAATVFVVSVLAAVQVHAQTRETFDIVSYIPPQRWTKDIQDFAVSYSITDQKKGAWAQIGIYRSVESSGDPVADFNSEWTAIIEPGYKPTSRPVPERETSDGWTSATGAAVFAWQGTESYVVLTTVTGYGRLMSIVTTMNGLEYESTVNSFMSGMQLLAPENLSPAASKPSSGAGQPAPESSSGVRSQGATAVHGITRSRTNFDDGWVSEPAADWVRVAKGGITVLLHYGIEITETMRTLPDLEGALFDRLILPRYTVSNIRRYDNGGPCFFCIYFLEADAVEKSGGRRVHLGLRIIYESGVARCIETVSPSRTAFQSTFPDQERIAAMSGYNRFAVTAADLYGTWDESTGSYVDLYNTVTGSYAGMNSASAANTFVFNRDGSYQAHHRGAFGMVGSQTVYDQKYDGRSTISDWEISLTNGWQGKTEVYWANFEAVRGGRVLHLTDSTAPGVQYHLVKTR